MSFELREHTADVAVEAVGESLDAVFGAVADGMAAAMCDEIPTDGDERFDFSVTAEGREALLFDYLDELIYERDVRVVLPVDNEATVSAPSSDDGPNEWVLSGSARGVPLERVEARDLKAVTYSEMDLSETDDGWHAYVVFDV
ncbi:archease [Halosimplex litoreum]|uniref:Archease n=1 Tax=Halosimplex litoreum TaxID=1198301 RepID=A0A7T3FYG3_9EURY|nr:archease [Halosimplex litoreum]QPV62996.1 archease [Halosimplex litoreum]